jgi:hypothetical protein
MEMTDSKNVAHRIEWTIIPEFHPRFDHKFGGLVVGVYDSNGDLLTDPYILNDEMKKVGDKEWDIPLPSAIDPDDYNGRISRWDETVAAIAQRFNVKNWYPHVQCKKFSETMLHAYALPDPEPSFGV